jgi:hypothetical protein
MNKSTKRHKQVALPLVLCFCCIGLTGCQLPKELFPETTKYREEQERQKHPVAPSEPQKQPFKKVTPEERDRAERDEFERKKYKEAGEMLRALS